LRDVGDNLGDRRGHRRSWRISSRALSASEGPRQRPPAGGDELHVHVHHESSLSFERRQPAAYFVLDLLLRAPRQRTIGSAGAAAASFDQLDPITVAVDMIESRLRSLPSCRDARRGWAWSVLS
jgi:hypothetical protein